MCEQGGKKSENNKPACWFIRDFKVRKQTKDGRVAADYTPEIVVQTKIKRFRMENRRF